MAATLDEIPVLWLTAGLSCDGDSIAMTAATQPSLEDLVLGAIPGVPRVRFHHPVLAYEVGDEFLAGFEAAAKGELDPFILIVEGSVPDESANVEGCWAGFGTDPDTGQAIPTTTWIDRLAPRAWAVVAVGTCATYGGIHAMAGNPTGAMGLADYLGWDWRSAGDLPIVNIPGCPVQPDNCTETLLYLLRQAVGAAPTIPLDHVLRPKWLFGQTLHEGCDRAGYYEQGDFAIELGSPKCIVKLGCWGPVVDCNVGKRGWINGVGGCANVGGTCIGCTMPGFPDKFQPFLDEPPGAKMSSSAVLLYGRTVRALRNVTRASMNVEPEGRGPGMPPQPAAAAPRDMTDPGGTQSHIVDKSWDPITRIVGSLGIHARIDFRQGTVLRCHSTSSIFRGYSVFMKGKDPRDAHVITSRICGICGDNHATASVYAQQMAYGIKPPHLAEWIINLAEAAEYMFDHNLYQENLVGVDFCERMVRDTNSSVLDLAERTEAPHAGVHGYRTIADIMRAFNPMEGDLYLEALHMSRVTREMFCLMEGRHVHPSTLYPGGVGTVPSVQLFNDYLVRLVKYTEHLKRMVPLHDDLFDFFYDALPGYEEVGRRRVLLGSWGAFQDPDTCDFRYDHMTDWGRDMFVTPGVVVDGELVTTDLVDINLRMRILLGSSFYEDWQDGETFVTHDPLGNPVDQRHPWNQTTVPRPQLRNLDGRYTWVMSPRWLEPGTGEHLALDTGGGALARLWVTALAGVVDTPLVTATGESVKILLPRTARMPEAELEWRVPQWSNAIERDRARTYFQAYSAAMAFHFLDKAMTEVNAGRLEVWTPYQVPDDAVSCGFHEAVRGLLSHHMVIRDGKIANYHPYPPTCWNASPRDSFGTPGPYEDAVQGTPIFEENGPDTFKGIDIMRVVRSFDPCLPCGVHLYLGRGRVTSRRHSPASYLD